MTIWSWLFDSKYSLARNAAGPRTGGFRDGSNNQFLSFDDVRDLATQLSTALRKCYSIDQGDGVCIFASNTIWYPIVVFASVRLGAVVTGSSPEYSVDETYYILKSSRAKLVFTDQGSFKAVSAAADSLGIDKARIILLGMKPASKHTIFLQTLLTEARSEASQDYTPAFKLATGQSNKTVCAYLSFTSGTTSRPKGVSSTVYHNLSYITNGELGNDFSS